MDHRYLNDEVADRIFINFAQFLLPLLFEELCFFLHIPFLFKIHRVSSNHSLVGKPAHVYDPVHLLLLS